MAIQRTSRTKGATNPKVISVGTVVAAFLLGVAVGFLNNTISNWAYRYSDRRSTGDTPHQPTLGWPALFGLQFVARLALSVASLFLVFRASGGQAGPVLANLAGLLLTRYFLLWRLSRTGAGGLV